MSFNKVILSGRVCSPLELRSASGVNVLNFSLAVNEYIKGQEYTSFFNCVAFSKTAEFLHKNAGKGSLILIEATLKQNRYEDAQGNKRSKIDIIAQKVELLSWINKDQEIKEEEEEKKEVKKTQVNTPYLGIEEEEDMPF